MQGWIHNIPSFLYNQLRLVLGQGTLFTPQPFFNSGPFIIKMKNKTREWIILTGWERNSVVYHMDLTGEDVSDTEIAMCVGEQVYGGKE